MRLGEVLCLTHADSTGLGRHAVHRGRPRGSSARGPVEGGRGRRIYVSDELERLYGDYLWDLAERPGGRGSRSPTSRSASAT